MSGVHPMNPAAAGVKLTWEDLQQFPEDGKLHELIDGEHIVTAAPNLRHQIICGNLFAAIRSHLQVQPTGLVVFAPMDVILSSYDVLEPDLLYISHPRRAALEPSSWIKGAPELVVEIGSPSTRKRDETVKRRLYEQFGVEEYWVVDPDLDSIKVYRQEDGRYVRVAELTSEQGDILTTPLLPGLQILLVDVFRE